MAGKYRFVVCSVLSILLFAAGSMASAYTNRGAQEFVEQVYALYAAEKFSAVYNLLHPAIKEEVTEAAYVSFQRKHFERLGLEILETTTEEPTVEKALPRDVAAFFGAATGSKVVLAVPISYRARFYVIGKIRQTRTVNKNVTILFEADTYHLLWDPSPVKENSDG